MSYIDEVNAIRAILDEKGYKEIPDSLDPEEGSYNNLQEGYKISSLPLDTEFQTGSTINVYAVQVEVTYIAKDNEARHNADDAFFTLANDIVKISTGYVTSPDINRLEDMPQYYVGIIQVNMGSYTCV